MGLPAAIGAVSICRHREAKDGFDLDEHQVRHDVAEVWYPAGAAKHRSILVVPLTWQPNEHHGYAQPDVL